MPRQFKTYQTSLGFFDLAIAAPSMKAALESWGSKTNLFHQGFAKETTDPAIVQATMAKPGVVLKRPVGSNGPFTEHAGLPKHLPVENDKRAAAKPSAKKKRATPRKPDAARMVRVAFEKEEKSRHQARRKEEAARAKEGKRHAQAFDRAEGALEAAKLVHEKRIENIEKARAALDGRFIAENARWAGQKKKLETALGRARG